MKNKIIPTRVNSLATKVVINYIDTLQKKSTYVDGKVFDVPQIENIATKLRKNLLEKLGEGKATTKKEIEDIFYGEIVTNKIYKKIRKAFTLLPIVGDNSSLVAIIADIFKQEKHTEIIKRTGKSTASSTEIVLGLYNEYLSNRDNNFITPTQMQNPLLMIDLLSPIFVSNLIERMEDADNDPLSVFVDAFTTIPTKGSKGTLAVHGNHVLYTTKVDLEYVPDLGYAGLSTEFIGLKNYSIFKFLKEQFIFEERCTKRYNSVKIKDAIEHAPSGVLKGDHIPTAYNNAFIENEDEIHEVLNTPDVESFMDYCGVEVSDRYERIQKVVKGDGSVVKSFDYIKTTGKAYTQAHTIPEDAKCFLDTQKIVYVPDSSIAVRTTEGTIYRKHMVMELLERNLKTPAKKIKG